MRGIARRSWATRGIGAAGIAGLAVVAAAVMLLSSSGHGVPAVHAQQKRQHNTPLPTSTPVPPTATVNPDCQLNVSKSDSPDPVAEGGDIHVHNHGDERSRYGESAVTSPSQT